MSMLDMKGKKGLIVGLTNDFGMPWMIAQACAQAGAELAIAYLPIMEKRAKPLAEKINASLIMPTGTDEKSLDALFKAVEEKFGKLDFMLHPNAFSDKNELKGAYVDTTRENFKNTMDISVYGFTDACRRAAPLMKDGGACLCLTYFGAEKVMPHYNVMGVAKAALECSVRYLANDLGKKGIRVNAMSAGPVKTLAAAGISDFRLMFGWNELNAPLRRNVAPEDIAGSGLYLLSNLSSGVTGETHYVDCGYNIVGMMAEEVVKDIMPMITEKMTNNNNF
ncbi:MAG: SDR family oxidoreductase [Alphaproteobacteria bacterium]|nr:SDR family oxidoreductase [Alphaproteobacteria bacterium]MBN2779794.1 SDR family oxidoreductase [Alphaproteobacteria bacterium]